jgi:hypothetical protein
LITGKNYSQNSSSFFHRLRKPDKNECQPKINYILGSMML